MSPGGGRPAVVLGDLLRLLRTGTAEEVCATSIVLRRLKPDDPRLVPAIVHALDRASPSVRPYLMEALGACGPELAAPRLLPYLGASGACREQAILILESYGSRALPQIEKAAESDSPRERTAAARILAGIGTGEALDRVLDMLQTADFPLAKAIASLCRRFVRLRGAAYAKRVGARSAALLAGLPPGSAPTAEIALLKILPEGAAPRSLAPLLTRLDREHLPALRFAVLEALARIAIPPRRQAAVARAVLPALRESSRCPAPALALRVLRRIEPLPLDLSTIADLLQSGQPAVRRLAIRELPRFPHGDVVPILLELLRNGDRLTQKAAALALSRCAAAVDSLLAAYRDPEFANRREWILAALSALGESLSEEEFDARLLPLLDAEASESELAARLPALARVNRSRINGAVAARAGELLAAGRPAGVPPLLEPLVRQRLASPEGRFLLLVAYLNLSGGGGGSNAARRACQLAPPLAKLDGFELRRRLRSGPLLTPEGARCLEEILPELAADTPDLPNPDDS